MSGFDRMPDPRGDASASGRRARRALLGAHVEPGPEAGSRSGVAPHPGSGGELPADAPVAEQVGDRSAVPAAGPVPPPSEAAVQGPGVACTRCGRSSVLGVASLLTLLRPPVLWLPWKAAPLRAVCPACRRRAWLHPRLEVCAPA